MIKRFYKQSLEDLMLHGFSALTFTPRSIRFNSEKLSRSALADLCSLIWQKLGWHSSVVNGAMQLSPACSWNSLSYNELNCLVRVLLTDYIWLYRLHASHVVDAYIEALPSSPFASFLSVPKINVELPVAVYTCYVYNGKSFHSESDLWDYIHKEYPQSKYNVSLKF